MRKLIVVLTLVFLFLGATWADEITVAGNTSGTFTGGSNTTGGLTFNGTSFSNTTLDGFASLNLGSFFLTTVPYSYAGKGFELLVDFTLPTVLEGGSTTTFTAKLFGTVSDDGNGGVKIHFTNNSQDFTFANSGASGSFSLSVNDISPQASAHGAGYVLTGDVFGSQSAVSVPEPAALTLLVSGLLSSVVFRKKFGVS